MTPRLTVSEQLALGLAGVLETRELHHACRCDWQRLATGGWQMHRVNPRCIIHADGCRRCQAQGEIPTDKTGAHPGGRKMCPRCLGTGIQSRGKR